MQLGPDGFFQLTYCTNIHPGNGWDEVFANLRSYAPALKAQVAPDTPFGIGLRLSGQESSELLQNDRLAQFQAFLTEHRLYIFTLNGFPYGPFHKQPVKAEVYAPDWRDEERVRYTLRLIEILAHLLPDDMEGSISTCPLSYKAWLDTGEDALWERLTRNVVRVAEALVRVKQQQGKLIHLDFEPEPDGLLENSAEVVEFYTQWLLTAGADILADSMNVSADEARAHLLDHIRVCFDTCHMAVAYEDPVEVLDRFARVGIQVGKVQISAALKVIFPDESAGRTELERQLQPFAESVYLHQVVQRDDTGGFQQYPDLPDALPAIYDPRARQWRIHFHVPIFVEQYGTFFSTQDEIRQVFALLRERRFSRHLEIETYTWDVLPSGLKKDLLESISREFAWVRDVFV
ncbi:MAG: metabolite traffic protein EboE [Chloroflexota bacterium]|nr:metabolite traffic protein EboE [Chloroflexota bacterium]